MQGGQAVHFVVEFQRDANVITGEQGAALVGTIHPFCRAALGAEMRLRIVQILFIIGFEAHDLYRSRMIGPL